MPKQLNLVIPNRRPYNDLWLMGRLPFKTRGSSDKTFEAHYGKVVYLYNSGKTDRDVLLAHKLTKDDLTPAGHIVAKGILKPFTPLKVKEMLQFERAVWNRGPNGGIYAMPFKLDFENLEPVGPIPFAWPPGPVRHTLWNGK